MEDSRKKSYIPSLVVGLICVLVVAYTIYHVSSIFAEDVYTITSGIMTESSSVSGSGYVFRNETLLYSANSGIVDYLVKDGEKVRRGQEIADVYSEEETLATREMIALLDKQIEMLEKSVASAGTDMSEVRSAASESFYIISRKLADREIKGLSVEIEGFLSCLNMIRSLMDGDKAAVIETLSALKSTRAQMIAEAGSCNRESVSESGYFYSGADGYEKTFTKSFAESADGDILYDMITQGATAQEIPGECYGKLAESSEWIFVMALDKEKAQKLSVGTEYQVELLSEGSKRMPMLLNKMLEVSDDKEKVALVFSCNRLPEGKALDRIISVNIDVESVSGIYVPKEAVEFWNGQRGVYVLKGSVVKFRAIDVIYERDEYYLVNGDFDDSKSEYTYLTTNELIIMNGQNLFDGRILD